MNSVGFNSYSREYVDGPTGYHKLLRVTVEIEAKIIEGSQSANFAELEVMRAAYSISGESFVFVDDDGNVLSWSLDSAQAIGGVRVLKPVSHQEIKGSHGVNWIKCQVTLQADFLQPLGENQYLSFEETLTFTGRGNPILVKRTPAVGKPFKQQVTTASWYYATQSGSLSTTSPRPRPMAPLFLDLLDGDEGDTVLTTPSPETIRGVPVSWSTSWSYRYSSPNPIVGFPNVY